MAAPSAFLCAVASRLPHGRVLDVACGSGRNARFFLARGDRVIGIDRARDALVKARAGAADSPLGLIQADLEEFPLPAARFDVVVNIRYLQRSLAPQLRRALRPGGVLVFETFLREQLALGHPRNPDFVLAHNELLRLFQGMRVLHYDEGLFEDEGGRVFLARLLAENEGL
jgi:SAM-dependent methyltransferase